MIPILTLIWGICIYINAMFQFRERRRISREDLEAIDIIAAGSTYNARKNEFIFEVLLAPLGLAVRIYVIIKCRKIKKK